jgi:hypothetical protein
MRTLPSNRWDLPTPGPAWLSGLALLLAADASPAVLLSDATSITTLMCVSRVETTDAPQLVYSNASGRIEFQLAVGQIAAPLMGVEPCR